MKGMPPDAKASCNTSTWFSIGRLSPAALSGWSLAGAAFGCFAVARSRSKLTGPDRESLNSIGSESLRWLFVHQSQLIGILGAIALLAAVATVFFRARVNRGWFVLSEFAFNKSPRLWLGMEPVVFLVWLSAVLVRLPTLPLGGFVNDDYCITRVNRTLPLIDRLCEPHNDHLLPGYRLEVAILDLIFGPRATGWNFALLAAYGLTLWLLARMMRQFKIHPLAAAVALFVFAISRTSSALLTGYYCVSTTMQVVAFCLGSTLAFAQSKRSGKRSWEWIGAGLLVIGALIDVSGIWILAGIPLLQFVALDRPFSIAEIRAHRSWLLKWLVASVFVVAVYAALRAMQHNPATPGGYENAVPLSAGGVLNQLFFYTSGGVILQLLAPIGGQWPVAFYAATFVGALLFIGLSLRLGSNRERLGILCSGALVMIFALEVAIGRPLSTRNSFWVQHVATAHLLSTMLIGCCLTALAKRFSLMFSKAQALAAITGVCTMLLIISGMPATIFYASKLAAVHRQQLIIREIGVGLEKLILSAQPPLSALPVIEAACIRANYAEPRPDNDLYELQFFLPRTVAQIPLVHQIGINTLATYTRERPRNVAFVGSVRSACGDAFAQALAKTKDALRLYGAPLELHDSRGNPPIKLSKIDVFSGLRSAQGVGVEDDGAVIFTSDGAAELQIEPAAFDPESRHLLKLALRPLGSQVSVKVIIAADSDPIGAIGAWFQTAPENVEPMCFDLGRLTTFAVSKNISRLRLRFVVPGQYRLTTCEF